VGMFTLLRGLVGDARGLGDRVEARLLLIEFGPRKSGDMGVVMDRQNGGYENGGINNPKINHISCQI
jgi:hypothetical protein